MGEDGLDWRDSVLRMMNEQSKMSEPEQPELEGLPTHLALLALARDTEVNTRLKLWLTFEFVEMTLRWIFAAGLAEVYAEKNMLPGSLIKRIRHDINLPTVGRWRAMNEAVADRLPMDSDGVAAPLVTVFRKYNASGSEGWNTLIKMRNDVMHGSMLSTQGAADALERIDPFVTPLIADMVQAHQYRTVWMRFGEQTLCLRGPVPQAQVAPAVLPQGDGSWLLAGDGVSLELRPLLVYEPIREPWQVGSVKADDLVGQDPVPQSYFRFDGENLFYTPIGVSDLISLSPDLARFQRFFPPVASEAGELATSQHANYMRGRYATFIGRRDELLQLERWIAEHASGGNIGLVIGGAGLGKSALMSRLASDLLEQDSVHHSFLRATVFHAFNLDNPYNDTRAFLLNVQERVLAIAPHLPRSKSDQPLNVEVLDLVKRFVADDERRLLILIDGLDEIPASKKFGELLLEMSRPGVTILAATRPHGIVETVTASTRAEVIHFGHDEGLLPPMQDGDIRSMLVEGLGARAKDIFGLDEDTAAGMRNRYVERVVERAQGKPIYVELLINDLVVNGRPIDITARLPHSVDSFYGQILARQGLSDAKTHVALIVCLLALSREPLSVAMLEALLSHSPGEVADPAQNRIWIAAALAQADIFLSRTPLPGDQTGTGYILYHQEFSRFIGAASRDGAARQLRWALGFARWLLVQQAMEPWSEDEARAIDGHMRRQGAFYLLESGRQVFPMPKETDFAQIVADRFLGVVGLERVLFAWGVGVGEGAGAKVAQGTAFLEWYVEIWTVMNAAGAGARAQNSLPNLLRLITSQDVLTADLVQATYVYQEKGREIHERLLAVAEQWDFKTPQAKVDWFIDIGAGYRRHGKLKEARHNLSVALDAFGALPISQPEVLRRRSRLEFDMAMVEFSCNQIDDGDLLMRQSAESARAAGDTTGVHMAEILGPLHRIKAMVAEGRDPTHLITMFSREVKEAKFQLMEDMRDDRKAADWPRIERTIMNCRATQFDLANIRGNADEAAAALDEFLSDPFVKRRFPGYSPITAQRRAQAHRLAGRLEAACAEYASMMPADAIPNKPLDWTEGIAQHYLDHGRVLLQLGRIEEARRAFSMGQLTIDDMANAIWKPRLVAELARL